LLDTVATVVKNDPSVSSSGRVYGDLRLRTQSPLKVLAGQFAMLKPHGIVEPLLRRAMAYFRVNEERHEVEFIYQKLGRGTSALALLEAGDEIDMLGPLGNTFDYSRSEAEALLVAGGVGSAALFIAAEDLVQRGTRVRLFIGGASEGDLCGIREFEALLGSKMISAATIDGSYGEPGFVTSPLEQYLSTHRDAEIYACGPDAMLHRVARIALEFSVPAQLSLEAPMACGFGICVGCAVAVVSDVPEGFVYKKVCTDGPVFKAEELYW
jgi:dihydroorotate dehydrogenase electron transfer subunit